MAMNDNIIRGTAALSEVYDLATGAHFMAWVCNGELTSGNRFQLNVDAQLAEKSGDAFGFIRREIAGFLAVGVGGDQPQSADMASTKRGRL